MTCALLQSSCHGRKAAPGQQEQPCGAAYLFPLSALRPGEPFDPALGNHYFKELFSPLFFWH